MVHIKTEFDRRVEEIDLYFNFVEQLQNQQPVLKSQERGNELHYPINENLIRIFKANGFLLLYNLVEFACKNSIQEIYNVVNSEKLLFQEVSEKIQQLWLVHQATVGTSNSNAVAVKIVHDIANQVIQKKAIVFDKEKLKEDIRKLFSGNIDARKIREDLAPKYGFDHKVTQKQQGAILEEVKKTRNNLAHGNITFVDCGADYSELQMLRIKDEVVEYLREILTNIETFLNQKHYKKNTVTP